jgi:hypothetical protein
LSHAAKLA